VTSPALPIVVTIPAGPKYAALADAELICDGDTKILAIRPHQSLQSAVAAAVAVLRLDFPHLHPDQVRELLLPVLPIGMVELDEALGIGERLAPAPVVTAPVRPPVSLGARMQRSVVTVTLIAIGVVLGWGVGHARPAAPPASSPGPANLSPYTADPQFKAFAAAGRMQCHPVTTLRARCTDTDGLVMFSEAAVSSDSVAYTFSYAQHVIFLRAFRSSADASSWGTEQGVRAALPNLAVQGRFALWGSDPARIAVYLGLLKSAPASSADAEVMPSRLAAIALGTLLAKVEGGASEAMEGTFLPTGTLVAVSLVMGAAASESPHPGLEPQDGELLQALLPPAQTVPDVSVPGVPSPQQPSNTVTAPVAASPTTAAPSVPRPAATTATALPEPKAPEPTPTTTPSPELSQAPEPPPAVEDRPEPTRTLEKTAEPSTATPSPSESSALPDAPTG